MRILGLDIGEKRIGVAVSDELGLTAQGLLTLERTGMQEDIKRLADIVQDWSVGKVVAGLPRNMNGTLGPQAVKVKEFVNCLQDVIGIEVVYQDERLTTAAAQRTLLEGNVSRRKRKEVVDKIAAAMILQNYLDWRRDKTP